MDGPREPRSKPGENHFLYKTKLATKELSECYIISSRIFLNSKNMRLVLINKMHLFGVVKASKAIILKLEVASTNLIKRDL